MRKVVYKGAIRFEKEPQKLFFSLGTSGRPPESGGLLSARKIREYQCQVPRRDICHLVRDESYVYNPTQPEPSSPLLPPYQPEPSPTHSRFEATVRRQWPQNR